MAVDQSKIVFPGTNFRLLTGDYGDATADLPANTVNYNGVWPAGMDDLGYTKGGIMLQINKTITDEYFDQDIDPVMQLITQRDIRFRTVIGETTPVRIAEAMGFGTVTQTNSTLTVKGNIDLDVPGSLPAIEDKVVAMEAKLRNGEAMRAILYRSQAVANVQLGFMKNTTVNAPFEARAMNDTSVVDGRVFKLRQVLPLAVA